MRGSAGAAGEPLFIVGACQAKLLIFIIDF